jgi:hypothetical protein
MLVRFDHATAPIRLGGWHVLYKQRGSRAHQRPLYAHQFSNDKIGTTYSKTGGSSVSVRLGYTHNGSTHYSGYFSISSGETVVKQFSTGSGSYCQSMTGVLNYSGGTFQTPSTHC